MCFHLVLINFGPGAGEGSMFARSKSESEPSGGTGPSGAGPGGPGPGGPGPGGAGPGPGGPGHLVGTWRRLPDLSTRLTPIHLVGKETDQYEKEQKYLDVKFLRESKNIPGEPLWQPLPGGLAACQAKLHT